MERTQAWLLVVVAASLGAGIAAFSLATPDQSTRIPRDELGFGLLDRSEVVAGFDSAGAHHRELHRTSTLTRAATGTVRRWLVSMPTGAAPQRAVQPVDAGESPAARARIRAVGTWLDGVPASSVRIVLGGTVPLDRERAWAVDAVVHVDVAQARDGTRRLRHPLVVEVAAPTGPGTPWRLLDAHVDAPRTWLRGYEDPTVLRGAAVHVVGPTAAAADVARALGIADRALPRLRRLALPLRGADRTTIWLVADRARAGALLGVAARAADPGHDVAWVDGRGELVIALDQWRAATESERDAALRHALFHVATLDGITRSPRALVEAVAAAHAAPATAAAPDAFADALATGSPGRPLAELLVADADGALAVPAERTRVRALGGWLADVHGPAVAMQLLQRVEAGLDPEQAVRRLLGATPGGVEQRVRAWSTPDLGEDPGVRDPRAIDEPEPAEEPTT